MKNYIIVGYVLIALLVSIYFKSCSDTSERSYSYNFGKALVWPVSIFHSQ